jgi:uncharacterized protein (TIGR03435 family)
VRRVATAVKIALVLTFSVLAAVLAAQAPSVTIGPARFDVASVKPNKLGYASPQRGTVLAPGERVSVVNAPAFMLLQFAYPGFDDIVGGPSWVGHKGPDDDADRFDVTAKARAFSTHEQLQTMLRALLAERFKLVVHVDVKREPVFAMVIARGDGRLGPKLQPEARDCETLRADLRGTPGAVDPCPSPAEARIPGHIFGRSRNLDLLVNLLRGYVGRPVVDRTGLTGSFDWDLVFTPQPYIDGQMQNSAIDPNGSPVFTAVQEQLGLKLVPDDGGVPVLVIDRIDQPTPD